MNRDTFVFYKSFLDSIEEIENEVIKSKAYKTIALYALFGEEPAKDCEEVIRVIFRQAKPLIDISNNRYNNCVINGKKGGAPKGNKNAIKQPKNNQRTTKKQPKDNQELTKKQPRNNQKTSQNNLNDNCNDNVNENVNVNEEREKQVKEFFSSLSRNYPKIEINAKTISQSYDLDKILNAIKQSKYLQNAPLSFIIKNYEKVITSYYKSFDYDKNKPFISRDYSNEPDLFEFINIDDVEI